MRASPASCRSGRGTGKNRECNDREHGRSAFTAYGEAGRRLSASGDLAAPEQIFHLAGTEMIAALGGRLSGSALRHLVADRARRCADWQANPAPEVI